MKRLLKSAKTRRRYRRGVARGNTQGRKTGGDRVSTGPFERTKRFVCASISHSVYSFHAPSCPCSPFNSSPGQRSSIALSYSRGRPCRGVGGTGGERDTESGTPTACRRRRHMQKNVLGILPSSLWPEPPSEDGVINIAGGLRTHLYEY